MTKEPNLAIGGSVSAILGAIFLILKGSGVVVPNDVQDGVNLLIMGLCAIPFVTTWLARFFVYSPATVQEKVDTAAVTGRTEQII